ncbi:MAG: DUF5591 domain-containing protein [Methanogenium sp.]|jgi:hypothetical protein
MEVQGDNYISDVDLMYKLSYNILSFRMNSPQKALYNYDKKWGKTFQDLTKEDIISWGNSHLCEILKEENEIIPRKYWDLDGLRGATSKQLLHPHFDVMKDYFFQNFTPSSSTAVVMLCANKKPYSHNSTIKQYYKLSKQRNADFFILSNPGVIPIQYDNHYPFRWYEWNEYEETPEIKKLYYEVTKQRIEEWFNKFLQYKKVISVVRPGETSQAFLTSNIPQGRYNVFSEDNIKKITDVYLPKFKTTGLLKTRLLSLSLTKDLFLQCFDN